MSATFCPIGRVLVFGFSEGPPPKMRMESRGGRSYTGLPRKSTVSPTLNRNSNGAAALMVLFATASWGSLFHAGKSIIGHVDAWWFSLCRYSGATVLLVGMLAATGALRWRLLLPNLGRLAFHGIAGFAVFGIVVFIGMRWTVAAHAALIMATMPISTIVARSLIERRLPPAWTW